MTFQNVVHPIASEQQFMSKFELLALPSIVQLKLELGVEEVGTGIINPALKAIGLQVDNSEAQHPLVNQHGAIQFNTGVEFPLVVYRGQTQEHNSCVPGLGRPSQSLEKKLIKLCQNIAFEDAIRAHPYVRFCANQDFNGHPLHISFQGLAQHYGFHTDMLDVTSNFDVAAFFATSKWNPKEKRYCPVGESPFPGILYYAEPAFYLLPREDQSATFEFVGWQPLKRPAQQRAGAFRLLPEQCFSKLPGVRKAHFRHSLAVSERIWQSFDGGAALFPNDEAAALSEEAQDLNFITQSQLERAWGKLEAWERKSFSDKQRKRLFRSSGLKLVTKSPLNWDKFNLASRPEKLRKRLNSELSNIRFRQTYRPS